MAALRLLALLPLLSAAAPASLAPTCSSLTIDARAPVHTTAAYYASFNIDSSTDRSFFLLDWTAPALRSAAAGLTAAPARLRFGGTGNNALIYNFSNTPCTPAGRGHTCLNESTWAGVAAVAAAAVRRPPSPPAATTRSALPYAAHTRHTRTPHMPHTHTGCAHSLWSEHVPWRAR